MTTLSVVIATYERPAEVGELLRCLGRQSMTPHEVLVVDDSVTNRVREAVSRAESKDLPFPIHYIRNAVRLGLTASRNVGVRHSTGAVVLFLDDDVRLDPAYLETIARGFAEYPEAVGIQGFWGDRITMSLSDKIINTLSRMFALYHYRNAECRVLASTNSTYPLKPKSMVRCQWLSGSNQAYRRWIFDELTFDEAFAQYAYKEDLDFSYRTWKRYPNGLLMLPNARLTHDKAAVARMDEDELVLMRAIHSLYIFHKTMDQSIKNRVTFGVSKVGELALLFALLALGRPKNFKRHWNALSVWFSAQRFCRTHRNAIRNGALMDLPVPWSRVPHNESRGHDKDQAAHAPLD